MKPVEDRVIILPAPIEKEQEGFYQHSKATEKPLRGEVVAVGPGKYILNETTIALIPMNIQVGDKVIYGKHIGTEIVIDDVAYMIMRVGELFAIL